MFKHRVNIDEQAATAAVLAVAEIEQGNGMAAMDFNRIFSMFLVASAEFIVFFSIDLDLVVLLVWLIFWW